MESNDPATHDVNDASATQDINDDNSVARAGFASDDTTAGTAAPGLPQAYTGPVSGLQHKYVGITGDQLNIAMSAMTIGSSTPVVATMQSRCTAEQMCWMGGPDRTS
jgi:hypothetical protein